MSGTNGLGEGEGLADTEVEIEDDTLEDGETELEIEVDTLEEGEIDELGDGDAEMLVETEVDGEGDVEILAETEVLGEGEVDTLVDIEVEGEGDEEAELEIDEPTNMLVMPCHGFGPVPAAIPVDSKAPEPPACLYRNLEPADNDTAYTSPFGVDVIAFQFLDV